jgi:hypothetical protein
MAYQIINTCKGVAELVSVGPFGILRKYAADVLPVLNHKHFNSRQLKVCDAVCAGIYYLICHNIYKRESIS